MLVHRTLDELEHSLGEIHQSPRDRGQLKAIVIRPATDERISLPHCELSPEGGVQIGDEIKKL